MVSRWLRTGVFIRWGYRYFSVPFRNQPFFHRIDLSRAVWQKDHDTRMSLPLISTSIIFLALQTLREGNIGLRLFRRSQKGRAKWGKIRPILPFISYGLWFFQQEFHIQRLNRMYLKYSGHVFSERYIRSCHENWNKICSICHCYTSSSVYRNCYWKNLYHCWYIHKPIQSHVQLLKRPYYFSNFSIYALHICSSRHRAHGNTLGSFYHFWRSLRYNFHPGGYVQISLEVNLWVPVVLRDIVFVHVHWNWRISLKMHQIVLVWLLD